MPRRATELHRGEVMRKISGTILVAMISAPVLASSLAAQITARPLIQIERPSRFTIGGGFVVSQPKGEFAENIDNGFGIDAYGLFRLDPTGVLSLRADLGGSQYGSETLPAGYIYGGARRGCVDTQESLF